MPYCSSCGRSIPEGQGSSCSMCYGDIDYGNDGYYRRWVEEQLLRQQEEAGLEQQWAEAEQQRYEDEMLAQSQDENDEAHIIDYPDDGIPF